MARRTWSRYPRRTFYLFVGPWVAGFLLLTAAPLVYAFAMSLTNFDGSSPRWRWVGFRNYTELLGDEYAWAALFRTIGYTAIVVPLSVAGALGLAVLLNRRLKAVGLWRTVFYLPSVVPVVATAIMWKLVLNRDAGILNTILEPFGVDAIAWLIDPMAFYALIILTLWGLGGGMVIMLAALQGVPKELEDAARVDGAGRWKAFRHVTIPMISPVLYFQVVTGIIATLQIVVQPMLLTETNSISGVAGVPQSTHLYMVQVWEEFFLGNRFGYGSAMLWVFFVIILAFTLLVQRSSRWWVHYEVNSDADR
ncbi:carbohydrate ABC transporter permease [Planobispora longispora]|uniref:Sugar ABC transporter permease n=1 Tax=Planobispora longispora TaxID=28887 RepID=A0A8J3RD79_9ACTN|nr:sugar ABC transporter permease [Planobispora longispora]BFE78078.1 sugar ABC transporter permease [Planobispora longispora]GIH73582.1 sugar ABC transporter permease [Planobispora longispora]